jgi:hypothetical protein
MMFLELIADKLPLPLAIVADEKLFVTSGVTKKCVDAILGHTPQAPGRAGCKRAEAIADRFDQLKLPV